MFKYCPQCKNPLNQKEERLVECESCNFVFYFNPALTNGGILVNNKGEILLVKRKIDPKKGYWDVPGGFVDFRETIEDSMKREVKEELGIDLSNIEYFMSTPDLYEYKGFTYNTLCFFFITNIEGEVFTPADDITEARFFTPDMIPFEKIAFDGVKRALASTTLTTST